MPVRAADPVLAGVRLSHPGRVLWEDAGITKHDLARWYAAVGDRMLPHVADRPLTLVRCPRGVTRAGGGAKDVDCHYLRHGRSWGPSPLRRVRIAERTKVGEYLVVDDLAGLIALAQMDVIEVHTWNTRSHDVERPDRVLIDLDPGPAVGWAQVVAAAHVVRAAFAALGLASWAKTTGGRGLHVVAPLLPERPWGEVLAFARGVAEVIAARDRARFTTAIPKAGRAARILLDYLRNNRANTAVAAYSPRARPRAPVSWPVAWEMVDAALDPGAFTLADATRRLRGRDPWSGYWTTRQRIEDAALAAVRR